MTSMRIRPKCFQHGGYNGMPCLRPRACLLLISVCGLLLTASQIGSRHRQLYDDTMKLESISREGREEHLINKTAPKGTELPPFEFVQNCEDACANDTDIDLVIIVISDIDNFHRRHTIRNTWGSIVKTLHAKVVFLVAGFSTVSLQSELDKESARYNDIIQIILIGPNNSPSLKSIAMLQWLKTYCTNSEFYMKIVDDTFVNVDNAISIASAWKSTNGRFFVCYVTESKPINNKALRHCTGTAYIFSSDLLLDLHRSCVRTETQDWDESLFITGLAAGSVYTSHVHDKGFSEMPREPTGCAYKEAITGYGLPDKDMYHIFADMHVKGTGC